MNYNESELNMMDFPNAKNFDKRSFIQYYFSLIKTRHPLISSFLQNNDYNSMIIKICLFFFSFALAFVLNSLFFTDETMHKILEDEGIFNFIYNIPKIIYSTLISIFINIIIKKLALSQESILVIKQEKEKIKKINSKKNPRNSKIVKDFEDKAAKMKRNLIIKFILFFTLSIILLSFFWFYLGCFCAVYQNTQIYLLKDTLLSFILSLILPFIKFLIPCIIRIYSLRDISKRCYNCSKMLQ